VQKTEELAMKPRSRKLKAIAPVYKIHRRKQIIDLGTHRANIGVDSEVDNVDARAYIKTEPALKLEFKFNTTINDSSIF
jgi:hypothetical protein